MSPESRADYFKKRRSIYKSFTVEVQREKMDKFESWLKSAGISKAEWLNKKIEEEIGSEKE